LTAATGGAATSKPVDALAGLASLRQHLIAASPPAGLMAAAFGDMAGVLREAELAPLRSPSTSLSQGSATVAEARADLLAAEQALAAAAPGQPRPTAAATPEAASLAAAQQQLAAAQQQLLALEAGPAPATVDAARQAVAAALAAVPAAPSTAALNSAQTKVAQAQQALFAATEPSVLTDSDTAPVPQAYIAPVIHGTYPRGPAAVSAPPQATGAHVASSLEPSRVATAQANLDSANAAVAALQQQAANAANPDSQPAVAAAEQRLAALQSPVSPDQIVQAQATVDTLQQQVDQLLSPGPSPSTSSLAAAPGQNSAVLAAAQQRLTLARQHLLDLGSGASSDNLTPRQRLALSSPVGQQDLTATEISNTAQYVVSAVLAVEGVAR